MSGHSQKGKAYGFLKTGSSSQRIKQAFSNMKADPETMVRPGLDISVALNEPAPLIGATEDVLEASSQDLEQLRRITVSMGKRGANCIIIASLLEGSDRQAADELGHVFNLMYSCTEIMGEAEVPVADIYFKDGGGRYLSKLEAEPTR